MAVKKTFYDRHVKPPKKKNYGHFEVIFYLEILPINKQSAIIKK